MKKPNLNAQKLLAQTAKFWQKVITIQLLIFEITFNVWHFDRSLYLAQSQG